MNKDAIALKKAYRRVLAPLLDPYQKQSLLTRIERYREENNPLPDETSLWHLPEIGWMFDSYDKTISSEEVLMLQEEIQRDFEYMDLTKGREYIDPRKLIRDGVMAEVTNTMRYYYKELSPRMHDIDKDRLLHNLLLYTDMYGTYVGTETSEIPILRSVWKKDYITNLEIAVLANCIGYDVIGPTKQ